MAVYCTSDGLPNCKENEGYWQTTQLKYTDGLVLQVTLDLQTIKKLEAGDVTLMEEIRRNAIQSNTLIQPEGFEKQGENEGRQEAENPSGWSREAILYLISLYKENGEDLEDPLQKKKDIWKKITEEMHKRGYMHQQQTVESKWRNLLHSHKEIRRNNSLTGRKRKTFQYFQEIEEIVKKRHDVYPVYLSDSSTSTEKKKTKFYTARSQSPTNDSSASETSESQDKVSSDVLSADRLATKTNSKRKTAESQESQLLMYLKEKEERRRKERAEAMKKKDEQEKERNSLLRELISVLKD